MSSELRGCVLALIGKRHRRGSELATESCFVTALQHTGLAKQRADRVGRLCAAIEPIVDAVVLQIERLLTLTRSILADHFDELAVARAARVGDDDTVRRLLFAPGTTQADF